MRLILILLVSISLALASAPKVDSIRVLRIQADIPGAWDQGGLLLDQLESALNGFSGFQVVPREEVSKMLSRAQIDPVRRDSAANALIDAHFPAPYRLDLKISPPLFVETRTPVLFWLGRRQVKLDAAFRLYTVDGRIPELAGDYSVDTLVSMGYCGLLDCVVRPMDVQMRLRIERDLYNKLVARIRGRLEQMLVIPAEHRARLDSLEMLRVKDSLRSRAMQDSLDAVLVRPDTTKTIAPKAAGADSSKASAPK